MVLIYGAAQELQDNGTPFAPLLLLLVLVIPIEIVKKVFRLCGMSKVEIGRKELLLRLRLLRHRLASKA